MKINISNEAAHWYIKELNLTGEAYVRFYVRYGGVGGNIPGFSIGLSLDSPTQIHTSVTIDGVTFFIEETDAWYFEDKNLTINYNEQLNEPQFTYESV